MTLPNLPAIAGTPATASLSILTAETAQLPLEPESLSDVAEAHSEAHKAPRLGNVPLSTGLLMSIPEICRAARLGRTTIYGEIKAGALPAVKVGRRTLIRRTDFLAWLGSLPSVREAK